MKKLTLILTCFLLSMGLAIGQNVLVSGTVVDEYGDPVIGASIEVKDDASIGTITDLNGRFSLEVPSTARTLVINSVGMAQQEVAVAPNVMVTLSTRTTDLDEVVVVAYGTTTRAQFVGSAKAVQGERLAAISTSNVTNALQGAIAGVQVVNGSGQPGTGATIRIRGVGSINGGTTPLYIVDGAPYDSDVINLISPHDIESMTVLKDAASTAIYGARGANGVILITTKGGRNDNKVIVNLETKWGNSSRGVSNYNVMTDPAMYYETAYRAMYNSQIYNGSSAATAHSYANNRFLTQSGVGYQIYTVPDGQNIIGTNFKLNPNATLGYSDGTYFYTPDDWEKETLRSDNLRQEYNLSVQGGNRDIQYFVSAGYLDNPGLVNGSGFERYTMRSKIDAQATKWLRVGMSAAYTYANMQSPGYQSDWGSTGNVFGTANLMAPIYPFYVRNADGSQAIDHLGYKIYDSGTYTNFVRPGSAPRGNNAINLLIDENNANRDNFTGNIYATITPHEGLSLTARISPEAYNSRYNALSNPFYGSTGEEGIVSVSHTRLFTINQQYMANYKIRFGGIHSIEALVGYENYTFKQQSLSASNDHLYNPYIAELSNAFGVLPTSSRVSSNTENFATEGYFGRVQYDLENRYFLNATIRHEGISRFSPDNRWGTFGSLGAAWLVTREPFMVGTTHWLDELKFKISYGTQGNDLIRNYYAFRDLYIISYNGDTGEYSKVLSSKGNPDLTWEAQKLFNAGFEFSFFNRKLSGSVEYYSRMNTDMLFNVPMPPSAGYSSLPENIGSVLNNGFELDLNSNLVNNKHIQWNLYGNITYHNNEIKKLPDLYKENGMPNSSFIFKEGGALNQAYLVEYAGVDPATGQALYYVDPDNGDYTTTATYADAKQADLGDVGVKFYGGFGTSLEVYGFDVNAQFAYQFGGKAYDGTYQELMHTGAQIGRNWHMDILDAWTPENPNASIPRINTADDHDQKNSSRWLVRSNYLSLNNLTVGYTLPRSLTSKLQLAKVRIYFSGDNLALITARKGYDPRQSQNANATGLGISTTSGNYVYSQLRVLSGGLSITF